MALLNEEDDEDLDEEDLDIGTEIDPDSPPWDLYGEQDIDDNDDSNEDTALLRSKAARIVITPISPVSCFFKLFFIFSNYFFYIIGKFIT